MATSTLASPTATSRPSRTASPSPLTSRSRMTDGPDLPPPRRPRPVLAGTEALINEPRTDDRLAPHLTTGAGIAIAGIWLAAAGLTALLVMVAFVWAPERVL